MWFGQAIQDIRTSSNSAQDIAEYWQNNGDPAAELQEYWGHSAPASMEKVFPLRFYGDGADTTGLNAFELLTMISVSPKHSSTMKTRFVFLDDLLAIYVCRDRCMNISA